MRITYRWTTNRHSAVLMSITPPPLPTNSNGFVVNSPLLVFCLFWSSLVNFLLLASPVIGFVNTHIQQVNKQPHILWAKSWRFVGVSPLFICLSLSAQCWGILIEAAYYWLRQPPQSAVLYADTCLKDSKCLLNQSMRLF